MKTKLVLFVLAGFIAGCGRPTDAKKVTADTTDPLVKRFINAIDEAKDRIEPAELSPPSTNQGFWLQGGDLSHENLARGLFFASWQQGNDPVTQNGNTAVAAFKGWIFLRPNGDAEIIFAAYLYNFGKQNVIIATIDKDMSRCRLDFRHFAGTWSIEGHKVRIKPNTSVDPSHFGEPDESVVYDIRPEWLDERDAKKEAKLAAIQELERKKKEAAENSRDPAIWNANLVRLTDEIRRSRVNNHSVDLWFKDVVKTITAKPEMFVNDGRDYIFYASVFQSIHGLIWLQEERKQMGNNDLIKQSDLEQLRWWLWYSAFDQEKNTALGENYLQVYPIVNGRVFDFVLRNGELLKLRYVRRDIRFPEGSYNGTGTKSEIFVEVADGKDIEEAVAAEKKIASEEMRVKVVTALGEAEIANRISVELKKARVINSRSIIVKSNKNAERTAKLGEKVPVDIGNGLVMEVVINGINPDLLSFTYIWKLTEYTVNLENKK